MNSSEVIDILKDLSHPESLEGMARFGINTETVLGVSIPDLRTVAKDIGKNHELALELWKTRIHEARILASMIDDSKKMTEEQMDLWASDFNSWDVCDQCCNNLFRKTPFAHVKAKEWSKKDEEFIKRAGFSLMAILAVHDKTADDKEFIGFLSFIKKGADDERNFVKKAVNWALRQIGKRNIVLHEAAIEVANEIKEMKSKSALWIASDALRELTNEKIIQRIKK